jgi:hypothetical protein
MQRAATVEAIARRERAVVAAALAMIAVSTTRS